MARYSFVDEPAKNSRYSFVDEPEEQEGSLVGDLGAAWGVGSNQILKGVGSLYGLATGDMDNAATRQAESGIEYWQDRKSSDLTGKEQARSEAVASADGEWSKFGTAVWETISDPKLLVSFVTEQAPLTIATGGVGRGAAVGAKALGAGAKTTGAVGVGGAIGAGAGLQGSEVGDSVYRELLAMPEDVWQANPEYAALAAEAGPERAKDEIALSYARNAAAASGGLSVASQMVPGGRTVERLLGKGKNSMPGGLLSRTAQGMVGEGAQEVIEEGGGQLIGNIAKSGVDPNQTLTEGVGEASGLALVGGGVMGGAAGAMSAGASRDSTPQDNAETLEQNYQQAATNLENLYSEAVANGDTDLAEAIVSRSKDLRDEYVSRRKALDPTFVGDIDPLAQAQEKFNQSTNVDEMNQAAQEVLQATNFTPLEDPLQSTPFSPIKSSLTTPNQEAIDTLSQIQPQQDDVQSRLEAARQQAVDPAEAFQGDMRRAAVDRAMRAIESRDGVATPEEAALLEESGIGRPFDRIDESLAIPEKRPSGPRKIWTGGQPEGYKTENGAKLARINRERQEPEFQWTVEPMANGNFAVAGYDLAQETEFTPDAGIMEPGGVANDQIQQLQATGMVQGASETPAPAVPQTGPQGLSEGVTNEQPGPTTEQEQPAGTGVGIPGQPPGSNAMPNDAGMADTGGGQGNVPGQAAGVGAGEAAVEAAPQASAQRGDLGGTAETPDIKLRNDGGAWSSPTTAKKSPQFTGTPNAVVVSVQDRDRGFAVVDGKGLISDLDPLHLSPNGEPFSSAASARRSRAYKDARNPVIASYKGGVAVVDTSRGAQQAPGASPGVEQSSPSSPQSSPTFPSTNQEVAEKGEDSLPPSPPQSSPNDDAQPDSNLSANEKVAVGQKKAADKQARRNAVNTDRDSIGVAASKNGGISKSYMDDMGFDKNVNLGDGHWLFKDGGTSPDDMAMLLAQDGYLSQPDMESSTDTGGVNRLYELLSADGGRNYYIPGSEASEAQILAQQLAEEEAYAESLNAGRETEYAALAQEYGEDYANRARDYDDGFASFVPQQEQDLEYYEQQIEERDARLAADAERDQDAGAAPGDDQVRAGEAEGRTDQSETSTAQEEDGFQLGQETEESRRARESRQRTTERQQTREERKAKRDADREREQAVDRQAATDSVDRFELGQDVDQQLSGQNDLLSPPSRQPDNAAESKPDQESSDKPIDDFGEKLEGARKHLNSIRERMDGLSDEQIANSTLSEMWPKSDLDKIEGSATAALYHAIRDEIPTKPRKGYKLKRWVEAVKTVRELVNIAERRGQDAVLEKMREGSRGLSNFSNKVELLPSIGRDNWSRVGYVNKVTGKYRNSDGEMVPGSWYQVEIDGYRRTYMGKDTVGEIVSDVKKDLSKTESDKTLKFEIRRNVLTDTIFINKKGDKERRYLKTFDSASEAREYIDNNYDDLVAAWESVKDRDNVKKSDIRDKANRERIGESRREGDVTPEEFTETFGFRGVQFGNWVKQGAGGKDRQGMLNQAYDALIDLAEIVGIPPKAISLNGELGLAFGARGSGNASAHYEPGTIVINLTKTQGAGSLAHEWFHALDHYFQRKRSPVAAKSNTEAYITYAPENYYQDEKTGTRLPESEYLPMARGEVSPKGRRFTMSRFNPDDWKLIEGVRPEVGAAFASVVEALDNSPMRQRASAIDKGKKDGYWSRIIERAARSFESYVIAKMADKGKQNDYLANVVRIEDFNRNPDRYPYLLDSEIEPVSDAFDHLFQTVKTRETDQGVELYSKSQTPVRNPHTPEELRTKLDSAVEKGVYSALESAGLARIITSGELPAAIQDGRFSVTAFHGSPYRFDRFDSSKMGTGEGAQAYGWGHYFADRQEVAEFYRENLSNRALLDGNIIDDATAGDGEVASSVGRRMRAEGIPAPEAIKREIADWQARRDDLEKALLDSNESPGWGEMSDNFETVAKSELEMYDREIEQLRGFDPGRVSLSRGNTYQVKLPAEDTYLLWDKPLSEQSDKVQKALEPEGITPADAPKMTGRDVLSIMQMRHGGDKGASSYLHGLGINGIKYLDGSSRGQGEGSYNYVVFDDSAIEIEDVYYSKDGNVLAYVQNGQVTFVADNIPKGHNLKGLMLHEIGVHLKRMGQNDQDFQRLQNQFKLMARKEGSPAAKAMARVPEDTAEHLKVEEGLGYFVEQNSDLPLAQKVIAWFRAKIREWASTAKGRDRLKIVQWAKNLSDSDIVYMATEAVRAARDTDTIAQNDGVMASMAEEYGGQHRPMTDEGGAARLHDLEPAFGEDIYGPNALQYYGSGDARERAVVRILKSLKGNPDAEVTIYRGGPEAVDGINSGDWVTLIESVAQDYADQSGNGKVVKKTVKASEVTSWADSLLEFGYFPESDTKTSPDTGDIRYSRAAEGQEQQSRAIRSGVRDRVDAIRFQMQDKLIDLKRQQEGRDLEDDANPYQKAAIWEGKAGERLNDFDEEKVQPLMEKVAETGLELSEVGEWLVARHAREANAYLAEINPDKPADERYRLSGMSNEEAVTIQAKYADNAALLEVGKMVDAINSERVDMLVEEGLITPEMAAQWRGRYRHYVPLKREEADGADYLPPRGQGFNIKGKESKQRTGSAYWTPSKILSNTIAQYESSVVRAEKNQVSRSLLQFVEENPNPDFWEIDTERTQRSVHKGGLVEFDKVEETDEKLVVRYQKSDGTEGKSTYQKLAENDDSLTLKVGGNTVEYKKVSNNADSIILRKPARVIEGRKSFDAPNELTVKRDGEEFVIVFNPNNDKAMRLVTGMKNLQAAQMGTVMRGLSHVTRFLSNINTSYNPEFMISNFFRDIQTAAYNLSDTEISDMKGRVIKDTPKAMNGIRSALFGDGSSEWAETWEDFRKHGGKTGWIDIHKDLQQKERNLSKIVERLRDGKPSKGKFMRFVKAVEDMNTVVENGVRLASYKNALDAGLSKQRAAALAKDLTVNFNRKGNQGQTINALYMFFNAAVQGNMRLIQAMANSKKGRRLAYATIGFAAFLDIINRSLAGDDDDGENLYDALPDYIKNHNIIIMGEKEPIIKIPAPWGYNVLHTLGQVIGTAATGERFNALDSAARVGMSFIDAFNPVGSGTIAQVISPTVADPIVQIAENKTFAGLPLKPEHTYDAKMPKPEYQMHFSSAREMSKDITEWLNDVSGGNEIRPGRINISPEWIDLIVDHTTGGIGRTAMNTVDTTTRLITGEELETKNIPFVRKVTGFNNEHGVKSRYYEWSLDVSYTKSELDNLRGPERREALAKPQRKLIGVYAATEKRLRSLRKLRREAEKRGNDARVEQIDENIRDVMARFNERYIDVMFQ